MKTKLTLLLVAALSSFNALLADDLTAVLQQALFNEEADHDLAAAIKAYQLVVAGADAQRKLAATAVFRLGECYRKLGQTNEAVAQYRRLVRDYVDQTTLVTLSRQNMVGLEGPKAVATGKADAGNADEQIRLLEQAIAEQQAEDARSESLLKQLQSLSRMELRRVLPTTVPDALLNALLQQLTQAEGKVATLTSSLSPDHPEVKAVRSSIVVLQSQIDERVDGILAGLKIQSSARTQRVEALQNALKAVRTLTVKRDGRAAPTPAQVEAHRLLIERLQLEIKSAEAIQARQKEMARVPQRSRQEIEVRLLDLRRQLLLARDADPDDAEIEGAPLQNFSPAARAQLKELLQGEIDVASQLLAEQRKKAQVGSIAPDEIWRFERDVLGLQRQFLAVDGLVSAEDRKKWHEMLLEEIALAEKAVQMERKKLDAGRSVPSELAKLQRDVFALKRELVTFDATPAGSASAGVSRETAPTDEEDKEIRRIQALIKDSPDLINASGTDWTPLHQAASKGQLVVAGFLLENGASVDQKTSDNRGPAVLLAAERGHKRMVELLLAKGANPNVKNSEGKTALHEAAAKGFVAVIEVLLPSKAELEARNSYGETPLHLAIAAGQLSAVEALLKRGADINARRDNGDTPLHFAAARGDAGLVALLLDHGADLNTKNRSEAPPLWAALDQGHVQAVRVLLEKGANTDFVVGGESPAHRAVRRNSVEMVQLLLEHKARPDLRNRSGLTPLQSVVLDGRTPRPNRELIPVLIKAGANPNAPLPEAATVDFQSSRTRMSGKQSVWRFPMLIAALIRQDLPTVEALLANGADVNATLPENYQETALMSAIDSDSQELADAVLRYKPDLDARTKHESRTALHKAVANGNLKAAEALLNAGAKVDATDGKGWTPLHIAVEESNPELVRALLQARANPNIFAVDGSLPLSIARRTSGQTLPTEEVRRELNRLLLQHGADETLLRSRSITVTRRSRNFEQVVFRKGTNDFNRHTLYELLARVYPPATPRSEDRAFPDLRRIAIERSQAGSGTRQILVDLEARVAEGACTNDLWLEWGDLVEIREIEHPLKANWPGLDGMLATNISQCLGRTVNLIMKGRTNRIELRASASFADQTFGPDGRHLNGYHLSQDSFRIAEVLHRSGLLLTTSDLTRVRVRRRDPITGRTQEWTNDETKPDSATDLWLRDGDVIEVPEKGPNAAATSATAAAVAPNDSSFRPIPARSLRPPPEPK